MIKDIRSYCSCNNKTIRLACRYRDHDNILDVSDDSYFYIKLSRLARNKSFHDSSSGGNICIRDIGYFKTLKHRNNLITLHDVAN